MRSNATNRLPLPCIFLLAAFALLFLPSTAFAAQEQQDNITLEITTDKSEYRADDTIVGHAIVTNNNIFAVEDVTLAVNLPSSIVFEVENSEIAAASLSAGETLRIDFTATVPADNVDDNDDDRTKANGDGLAKTGDDMAFVIILLASILILSAFCITLFRKKLAGKYGLFSLVVLLAIALPASVVASPLQAMAGNSSVSTKESIAVKGISHELEATASYTLPQPDPVTHSFTFNKVDSATDDPLANAQFSLILEGGETVSAASDTEGKVTFSNIPTGTHTLTETSAPDGYEKDSTDYSVEVADTGVLINGTAPLSFVVENTSKSAEPEIFSVNVTNFAIDGSGVGGSTIYLTILDRDSFSSKFSGTTQVGANSFWNILIVPTELKIGDWVMAYQVEPGKTRSDWVQVIVTAG